MKEDSKAVLKLNGHDHKLVMILGKLTGAPVITVAKTDMVLDTTLGLKYENFPSEIHTQPVFYKHDNKYHVLLGRESIEKNLAEGKDMFKGRLLSSPALKAARIHVEEAPEPSAPAPQTRLPSPTGFENRPRIQTTERRNTPRADRGDPAYSGSGYQRGLVRKQNN